MSRKPRWQDQDPHFREESARYAEPVPSRELLLKTLSATGTPLSFDALADRLGVREPGPRQAISKRLAAMVRDGQLLLNRADEYCLIDRLPVVVGTVSGHKDGFGFLVPADGGDDLFLPYREMRMLMHGDRAAARVTGRDERGRAEGAVVEVLERRTKQVAGRFSLEGGIGFVAPDNRRISQRVVVPREAVGEARHGDLAVVEIVEQPSRNRDPVGRVLRVLPDGGGADTAIDLAIASHGLSHEFSPEALREARQYGRDAGKNAASGREDLRSLPLVTIDGEDARDFDDAVWSEVNATGFRLIVAIADVSHYVRPGMALDAEARDRATSVYFPNRVLPMLPEEMALLPTPVTTTRPFEE
jgi:ribonuclease R